MTNYHPTSGEIFKFMEETKYSEAYMFAVLRLFVTNEYDRDPAILERLKTWLQEMKEAKEDIERDEG